MSILIYIELLVVSSFDFARHSEVIDSDHVGLIDLGLEQIFLEYVSNSEVVDQSHKDAKTGIGKSYSILAKQLVLVRLTPNLSKQVLSIGL